MKDIFMIIAFSGLGAAIIAPRLNPRTGRIVFWSGAVVACVSVFLMSLPLDWQSGLGMSLFVGCAIVAVAYVNTEFITIGGKTYSLFEELGEDRDYGGGLTARKAWWLTTLGITMAILIGITYFVTRNWVWAPAASLVVIVLVAMSFGYRDAAMDKPVAAGQRLQLGLISVLTIGTFTLVYLGSYRATGRGLRNRPSHGRHQR